ncbi:PucR family transcriptional regulator ligand-binding domain-containing protein [Nonomuraea ferruginea]
MSTLAEARLIAGESGLGRIVQRLNVMEVPDILAWVKPHELLLTTGYPLRNTPQSLGRLVADLDERGLAALAIKLGRYVDELPSAMAEQADRLGFPLILLPNDVGFDDILNQVLTDILNRQAAVLVRAEEAHRALVQVVLAERRAGRGHHGGGGAAGRVGGRRRRPRPGAGVGGPARGGAARVHHPRLAARRGRVARRPHRGVGAGDRGRAPPRPDRRLQPVRRHPRQRRRHPGTCRHRGRARRHPAGGGERGREQVPRRLPARRAHRPG